MDKLKKPLKYILSFIIPVAVTAAAFGLVWFQYLREVPLKSESYYLNDRYDSLSSPLADGAVFTQEFSAHTTMYGIGVNFNVVDNTLDGTLKVTLTDTDSGRLLLDYQNNLGVMLPAGYTCFTLDTPVTESGTRNYKLTVGIDYITPEVSQGQLPSLRKSSKEMENFGLLTEAGAAPGGSLAVMVVKDMLGASPVKYYRFAGLFCAISAGVIMFILTALPKKKVMAVFLTVLSVCIMYHIVLPVYSSPDEESHYNTAYAISNKMFGIEFDPVEGMMPKRVTDKKSVLNDYATSAFTYRYIADNFGHSLTEEEKAITDVLSYRLPGYPLPYIGPALAISGARIMGLNGVVTPLLARFVNLLIFVLAVTAAWYITPVAKNGLLAVAMLPMTIHIGTSLSYDSFILSCAFLITALALDCAFGEKEADNKKLIALALLCVAIAPVKVVYAIVALVVFLIPKDRFKSKNFALGYKLAVPAAAIAAALAYNMFRLLPTITISLFPSAAAATKDIVHTIAETPVPLNATATFTVSYMLAHPGVTLKLVINTFFTKFNYYFGTVFGASLGYLNLAEVNINPVIISAFVLIMMIAFIPKKEDPMLKPGGRILAVFIFLGTLAMTIGLCLMWTPLDYDFIWGFQGRYLLPVMPLLMLSCRSKAFTVNKGLTGITLYSLFTLNLLTILNAFIVIFAR